MVHFVLSVQIFHKLKTTVRNKSINLKTKINVRVCAKESLSF